jgi:hypothetical protein
MKKLTMSPDPAEPGSSFIAARGGLQKKRTRRSWATQPIGSIGCRCAALCGSILLALAATAGAQTLRAPISKKTNRPPPAPPIQRENVTGVIPRAFQPGGNPLQMLNPKAPAKYGTAEEHVVLDPETGKWKGIKLFTFNF